MRTEMRDLVEMLRNNDIIDMSIPREVDRGKGPLFPKPSPPISDDSFSPNAPLTAGPPACKSLGVSRECAARFTHALTLSSGSLSHAPEALKSSTAEALALLAEPANIIRAGKCRPVKASDEEIAAATTSKEMIRPRCAISSINRDRGHCLCNGLGGLAIAGGQNPSCLPPEKIQAAPAKNGIIGMCDTLPF